MNLIGVGSEEMRGICATHKGFALCGVLSDGAAVGLPRPTKAQPRVRIHRVQATIGDRLKRPQSPRTTILPLTLGVGQMGEVMPAATAIFCPAPVS
jgi:hypothetical protein